MHGYLKVKRRTAFLAALMLSVLLSAPTLGTVVGADVTYTLDAHFDQGTLVNVNHDAPNNNQLQLNETSGTFPFIWVALSQRCTIAKINTATGAILGEYRTVADGATCNESSRTTVGIDGSVWNGHRGPGGVNHVGLVELSQCVDRNGSGTIETSSGYGDVLPWPGGVSDVANAADECILHHVDTDAAFTGFFNDSRHMSIDAANNLWVGDFAGGHQFIRINGSTGVVETAPRSFTCGGYGGLIDGAGVIWSANGSAAGLLRWDPNAPDSATNPRCVPVPDVYGLAIDPGGNVWVSGLFGNRVWKVSPDGNTILGPFGHGSDNAQGLAVSSNGDVWVSSSLFCGAGCTVGHLKNDGTFVGNVPNPTGSGSTGVSVDANGNIWTANRESNTATRIDPDGGPLGCGGTGCGDGTHVGAVDLTVNFPAGPGARPLPFPYNYSDMTGAQLLGSTAPQGTWTVTQDGTAPGTAWGTITWNTEAQGSVPAGAELTVEARAADTEAGLGSEAYVAVSNGTAFSLTGRFIQVRVTFKPNAAGDSPILSDIRIQTSAPVVGPPANLDLQPTGVTNTVGDEHCVTATVTDANGAPVPGVTVNFTVSGANTDGGVGVTDANGVAAFCYTGTASGDDTITATAVGGSNPSDTATKTWNPGEPDSLELLPETALNTVDEEHCVTATVRDEFGNPTPGVTVRFSVTPATFRSPSSGSEPTDASGQAEFCYTSAMPGDDVITAFADTNGDGVNDTPGEPEDSAAKTWEIPATQADCKVTYGATFVASNGDRSNAGGNANGAGPSGQQQFQDHGPAARMNVHSINVLSVTCSPDGTMASVFGKATIDGAGSFDYRIDLTNPTAPGPDRYRIRLGNGYDSGDQAIRGNVVIH